MKKEKRKAEWKSWYVLMLLVVVAILNYLDRTMISTMRESVISSIPMTDAQFGLLLTVFSWVYGAFCPIAGFLADRFKKTNLIIASLFVWSSVTLWTGYVTSYYELLATRALMGISEAFFIPAALSLIIECHKRQSLAIGILLCGEMLGESLGFLGGWIAESHTWNEAFRIFGWIGIAYGVFLIFNFNKVASVPVEGTKKDKPEETEIRIGTTLKSLFSKMSYFYLMLIFLLPGVVGWIVLGWLPTYYQEQFHLTQANAGTYATAFLYPASIIGYIMGGFIADKWYKTYPYARIVLSIIGFGVAAPCIFFIGYVHILWQAVALFLIYGFSRTFMDTNFMPVLCMVIDRRYRATGFGIINMMAVFTGGLSIYIAGALRDAHVSLSTVIQYASLGLMLCVILLFLVKHEVKKNWKF